MGADLSVYHVIRWQHVVHEVMEEAQANDGDQATFVGFDTLFKQMLSFEDQLLSEEFKNDKPALSHFQKNYRDWQWMSNADRLPRNGK